MKLIKSLENRGVLLKGTTRSITCQEGGFLNFLKPLMIVDLILMKSSFTPTAKSFLLSLGLYARMTTTDAAPQKEIFGSGTTTLIISKKEMEDITKIVK